MKNKQQIINELKQLTIDNKLQGAVSDELINILAYYLYEDQAALASGVLESSISTCTKMSSFITHAKDYMFNVDRPKGRYLYLYSSTLLSDSELSQLDDSIVYSGKFKLLFDGSGVITNNVNGTNYYIYKLKVLVDKYEYSLDPNTSKIFLNLLGDGYVELSDKNGNPINNINNELSGDLLEFISTYFNEYYNKSLSEFNLFALTTPNYGLGIYHKNITSQMLTDNRDKELIVYENYTGSISEDDIKRIKFSDLRMRSIISNNWSNNNKVSNFYDSYELGTINNPMKNSSVVPGLDFTTILVGEYSEPTIEDQYDLFLSFLGTKFGIASTNISKDFIKSVNSIQDVVNYATIISAITTPKDANYQGEGNPPPGVLELNKQIYSIIYSKVPNTSVDTTQFLIDYPIYRGFEWKNYKMFGANYDPSIGGGVNFLESTNDKHIKLEIEIIKDQAYDSSVVYSDIISDLINSTYCNGRLFNGNNGSGCNITANELINVITDRLGINIRSLVIKLDQGGGNYTQVNPLTLVEELSNSNYYGANNDNLRSITNYYLRCPEYYSYLYLDDVIVTAVNL